MQFGFINAMLVGVSVLQSLPTLSNLDCISGAFFVFFLLLLHSVCVERIHAIDFCRFVLGFTRHEFN